ncbi:unnamed protein product [Mortierella alpina]
MFSSRPSLAARISSTLLFAVLRLSFSAHLAHAQNDDHDSSQAPHDDGDGSAAMPSGKKNHSATAPAYQFTKTWPPFAEPTGASAGYKGDRHRPDPEYVRLLDASFMFYEAQRSGKLPPDQRVKWRNDSALSDGKDAGQDLSGGYFDAGNYMKFTHPLSFVLAETCYSGLEFYDGYVLAQQTHALDQMLRWGLDWLLKAHASNNDTLFVQVGIKEVDNEYWGPDTTIPNPRPVFAVNSSQPGTDVMASTAAAFTACSLLYRDKLKDPAYAETLKSHGEVLYHWAETAQPQQLYQEAMPAVKGLYESSSFWDDLAWGAAWMYRMTQNQTFADKALQYMVRSTQAIKPNDYKLPPIGWDDKSGLVYVMMAQLTRGTNPGTQWQTWAEQFATAMTQATAPCMFTPGGMLFCDGYSTDNSLVISENAALAMFLLAHDMESSFSNQPPQKRRLQKRAAASAAPDSTTQGKINAYKAFALKQVRYLLGENPEKTPYVVGIHPNSPVNPHSAQASGGNSILTIDTYPVQEAHVLLGAVVGGPDVKDQFLDLRDGWRHTEVALDYNAPFTALMAYQVMTSQDPPPYVTITGGSSSQQNKDQHGRLSTTSTTTTIAATAAALPSHPSESVSTEHVVGDEELGDKGLVPEQAAIIESRSTSPAAASNEHLVHSTASLQTLESIEVHK